MCVYVGGEGGKTFFLSNSLYLSKKWAFAGSGSGS